MVRFFRGISLSLATAAILVSANNALADRHGHGEKSKSHKFIEKFEHRFKYKGERGEDLLRSLRRLDLTEDQVAQIRSMIEEDKPALKDAKHKLRAAKQALIEYLLGGGSDTGEIEAKAAEAGVAFTELEAGKAKLFSRIFNEVLTPEQQEMISGAPKQTPTPEPTPTQPTPESTPEVPVDPPVDPTPVVEPSLMNPAGAAMRPGSSMRPPQRQGRQEGKRGFREEKKRLKQEKGKHHEED